MIKSKKIPIGATGVLGSHYVKRFLDEAKLVANDLPGKKFELLMKKFKKVKFLKCDDK